ncbi:MAG: histidine kinase [Flavobacteriales bacterium]
MKYFISILLFCASLVSVGQDDEVLLPYNASPFMKQVLTDTYKLMESSRYDTALHVLSYGFYTQPDSLTKLDQYYLHSYEAEIMYYTALFDIGLNSSLVTLSLAEELKNDTLIGSSANLIGLFMLNLNREREAVSYFKRAIENIPFNHNKSYLSYQYQAYANLGECYLKMGIADSSIYYSQFSLKEAELKQKERGMALALWNIGEAQIIQQNFAVAKSILKRSYELVKNTKHQDVFLMILTSEMTIAGQENNKTEFKILINKALQVCDDPRITNLSKTDFYEAALPICNRLQEYGLLSELYNRLLSLLQERNDKQIDRRLFVLEEYFKKNQNIAELTTKNEIQEKEIEFRRRLEILIGISAFAIIVAAFLILRSFRQKQKINELYAKQAAEEEKKEAELTALSERMEAIFTERNRIASDLHDDIGAGLSSIRIYSNAALIQFGKKPEETQKLLEKISSNSSNMMEQMSDIIWTINPKNDSGESLTLRMKNYALDLSGASDVHVHFDSNAELENLTIHTSARRNIYLIFKEVLNNALKYSKCSEILVDLQVRSHILTLSVSDNGTGFDVNSVKSGNGISNIFKRVAALNGEIKMQSSETTGTNYIISIDISNISDARKDNE